MSIRDDPQFMMFYAGIINRSMLNLHAVRAGLFDTVLCETDDPTVMSRWIAAVPQIVEAVVHRRHQGEPPSTST